MEWLGLILLYMISGFMKKRQQNLRRHEIESDPEWENPVEIPIEESGTKFDEVMRSLFDQGDLLVSDSSVQKDYYEIEDELDDIIENSDEIDTSSIDEQEQEQEFEDNIYHSKLSERSEQHYGNKWQKKTNLRKQLFESKKSLKKGIIIKEILDKPLALR